MLVAQLLKYLSVICWITDFKTDFISNLSIEAELFLPIFAELLE